MHKFRKKPVVIEAFQMTEEDMKDDRGWPDWLLEAYFKHNFIEGSLNVSAVGGELSIHTLEGDMKVALGDYIIQGVKGEIYPCKPDIFEATYDRIDYTEGTEEG